MIINVTQEDIEKGSIGNPFECPVAFALKKTFPHWYLIRVGLNVIEFVLFDDVDVQVETPEKVKEFILQYDYGEIVSPFEFEISDDYEARLSW